MDAAQDAVTAAVLSRVIALRYLVTTRAEILVLLADTGTDAPVCSTVIAGPTTGRVGTLGAHPTAYTVLR